MTMPSLAALCKKFLDDYSLNINDIVGHKDLSATLCPGKNFRMKELKELIAQLSQSQPQPQPQGKTQTLYAVQVGAFKVKDNAERLRKKLVDQGYKDAFIFKKTING